AAPGELTATLTLAPDAPFDAVVVRFLAADGTELRRAAATAPTTRFTQPAAPGDTFISVESDGRAVSYSIRTTFIQDALTITSVAPLSGGGGPRRRAAARPRPARRHAHP